MYLRNKWIKRNRKPLLKISWTIDILEFKSKLKNIDWAHWFTRLILKRGSFDIKVKIIWS